MESTTLAVSIDLQLSTALFQFAPELEYSVVSS